MEFKTRTMFAGQLIVNQDFGAINIWILMSVWVNNRIQLIEGDFHPPNSSCSSALCIDINCWSDRLSKHLSSTLLLDEQSGGQTLPVSVSTQTSSSWACGVWLFVRVKGGLGNAAFVRYMWSTLPLSDSVMSVIIRVGVNFDLGTWLHPY